MGDWFDDGGSGAAPVDVAAIWDSAVSEAVIEMIETGALVSIGTTRDGGALAITVTVDGRWRRGYFRSSEDATDWLSEAVPAVRSAVEALAASAERGKRQRRARGL